MGKGVRGGKEIGERIRRHGWKVKENGARGRGSQEEAGRRPWDGNKLWILFFSYITQDTRRKNGGLAFFL